MTPGFVSAALTAPARWSAGVPVDLGRDEARERARVELADPVYYEPPLLQRIIEWLLERVSELFARTAGALSGPVGLAVLLGLLALVTVVVVRRVGPPARRARTAGVMFATRRRSSAEHRAEADAAAARRDWRVAVVERYRAVVAGLEERGVIDPRPGRTADEAAADAGAVLPAVATDLGAGARLFDAVHYGNRPATADDDASLRRLDDAARTTRPARSSTPVGAGPAVPS
ncbi:MAG TPA: DUF4129 domain-containing protein [Jiangellaceae bacterium]|nr:DUF4129 domain-containing protein [Jiangellaceae bacterium]